MIFDVDGVLTDGTLLYGPAGEELKAFSAHDGHGLKMLAESGVACALLSGRVPESHVEGTIACTEFWLALFSRFENDVTRCLNSSSGERISMRPKR